MQQPGQQILNVFIPFQITANVYPDNNGNASVTSNCNSITFWNLGTITVLINGLPVGPGVVYPVEGNLGEICKTVFDITWQGATKPIIWVIRKIYQ